MAVTELAEVWCRNCERPSTVERDGEAYCNLHDPDRDTFQCDDCYLLAGRHNPSVEH